MTRFIPLFFLLSVFFLLLDARVHRFVGDAKKKTSSDALHNEFEDASFHRLFIWEVHVFLFEKKNQWVDATPRGGSLVRKRSL